MYCLVLLYWDAGPAAQRSTWCAFADLPLREWGALLLIIVPVLLSYIYVQVRPQCHSVRQERGHAAHLWG